MPLELRQLSDDDSAELASLWQRASDARRRGAGRSALSKPEVLLSRSGAFGVGIFDPHMVAMAVAMPALQDDAHSGHNVPGLAHISTVATTPARWGEGLGGRVVRAIVLQAIRRGFARAQLWTQATNTAAQRLYEGAGFLPSGRSRPHDSGEEIVHYLCDLPALPTLSRPAARMLCLDDEERLLLVKFQDPEDGCTFWEPPGGGVEAGETALEAVQREWAEETCLPRPDLAPNSTYVARDFVWKGVRWVTDEHFFLGRLPGRGAPLPADVDQGDAYLGSEWVPWRELADLAEPITPDLLPVLRRLNPNGPWTPVHP
jgi:8-oxo-dGTP pyrophosphatase MutT (NUDIX family)/ribosomal protein S18 acetylase RimI-like enzyme